MWSLKKTLRRSLMKSRKKIPRRSLGRNTDEVLRKSLGKNKKLEEEEPEEAQQMNFDFGITLPPPLASLNIELVVDIARFRALRAAQETARIENIRLRRELEEAQISNTLMHMGRDGAEREIFRLGAWPYGYHEEAVVARVVGVRPSEAIDVLAVYGESQPPMS
ncbi:hypothetical protein Tco_1534293 [Tanacetum coccineum]